MSIPTRTSGVERWSFFTLKKTPEKEWNLTGVKNRRLYIWCPRPGMDGFPSQHGPSTLKQENDRVPSGVRSVPTPETPSRPSDDPG